jgi:hypothetical protein
MVTVQCRSVPRPLPRVEFRHNRVVAPDLGAVIVQQYPAFRPRPVFAGGDNLGREGSILRRFERVTKPRPGFPSDVGHPKIIAVLETDIQR